jgi:ribosomal protein L20
MMPASQEVAELLEATKGEREAARFLKANPSLLFWTFFSLGGHLQYVVPEFGLGKSLKCDFLLMQSYSTGWNVKFVELEPVDDRILNKDLTPSRRLRLAQKQIVQWQDYAYHDSLSLRTQLASVARKRDILKEVKGDYEPTSFSGKRLRDPKTYISFMYYIVIGRRSKLSDEMRQHLNAMCNQSRCEIATYDRFIDTLKTVKEGTARPWP